MPRSSKKKFEVEWTTEDELRFIGEIRTKTPYLVGYKQSVLKRTNWNGIDKEKVCRVLGL